MMFCFVFFFAHFLSIKFNCFNLREISKGMFNCVYCNRIFMAYAHRLTFLFYYSSTGALPRVPSMALARPSLKTKCPFLITYFDMLYTVVSCPPFLFFFFLHMSIDQSIMMMMMMTTTKKEKRKPKQEEEFLK